MNPKLSDQEVVSFCNNMVQSFDSQFQTIDPLDTERARLKLYGLRQQLRAFKWEAKAIARKISATPTSLDTTSPLQMMVKTISSLCLDLDVVEYDINKNDPDHEEYFYHRTAKL